MLKIENISKLFNNKKILDDVSLEVKSGQIALLLGQSGVGKSTLLRILNNLESCDSGKISLQIDKKNLSLKEAIDQKLIGIIFQQFNLFENMSIERNISFVIEKNSNKSQKDIKDITNKLLEKYGLADKANLNISSLSGGQKQRLAIARTLSLDPKVICLDEPTSALDPKLTNFIANNIEELREQNKIILVATHDTFLIEKLDCYIYLMQEGKIAEQAQSCEYLSHKDKYPLINNFIIGKLD